ncbi:hypothetical protein [Rhizobium terrae]|uniref:hypothetical protein n=1 Tax=Rhizobium terrae TaxID=2171756 RepID=UPI000E3BFCF3|nr:hypothetical protein [Rhizobium terrae]
MKRKTAAVLAFAMTALLGAMTLPAVSQAQEWGGPRYDERFYDRREFRDRDYYRDDRRRPRGPLCGAREALAKATRYLSDPRIQSVDRQYVVVNGYGRRGEFNRVVFWNDVGCPRADK